MFLHIGKDFVIPIKDIIAIIDAETALSSKITKDFLDTAMEEGFIYDISENETRSYIISEKIEKGNMYEIRRSKIYASNISPITLLKRANFIENMK